MPPILGRHTAFGGREHSCLIGNLIYMVGGGDVEEVVHSWGGRVSCTPGMSEMNLANSHTLGTSVFFSQC